MLRDKVLARPRALQAMTFTSASVFAALALIVTIEAIRSLAAACAQTELWPALSLSVKPGRAVGAACLAHVPGARGRCGLGAPDRRSRGVQPG